MHGRYDRVWKDQSFSLLRNNGAQKSNIHRTFILFCSLFLIPSHLLPFFSSPSHLLPLLLRRLSAQPYVKGHGSRWRSGSHRCRCHRARASCSGEDFVWCNGVYPGIDDTFTRAVAPGRWRWMTEGVWPSSLRGRAVAESDSAVPWRRCTGGL